MPTGPVQLFRIIKAFLVWDDVLLLVLYLT